MEKMDAKVAAHLTHEQIEEAAYDHCFKAYEMIRQPGRLYTFNVERLVALLAALASPQVAPEGRNVTAKEHATLMGAARASSVLVSSGRATPVQVASQADLQEAKEQIEHLDAENHRLRQAAKLVGYLPAYEVGRLESGHDANLRSAKFGPSPLDGDVPVFLGADPVATQDDARDAAERDLDSWRPIDTAPKDGRVVLYWVASVRFQDDDDTGQVHEIDVSAADFGCWMSAPEHGEGYHDPFSGIPGDQGGVTHWMPVPAAPLSTPAAKRGKTIQGE